MSDAPTDPRLLLLAPDDNVLVLRGTIAAQEVVQVGGVSVTVPVRIDMGHKIARQAIAAGARIVKYGAPIGSATEAIAMGAHVHIHNVKSDYTPTYALTPAPEVSS